MLNFMEDSGRNTYCRWGKNNMSTNVLSQVLIYKKNFQVKVILIF